MDKILKLQKWAVRSITKSHYRSFSAPLFKQLKILDVYDTYKLEVGVFMWSQIMNSSINKVELLHDFSKITI